MAKKPFGLQEKRSVVTTSTMVTNSVHLVTRRSTVAEAVSGCTSCHNDKKCFKSQGTLDQFTRVLAPRAWLCSHPSEDAPDDIEGLDASATHVANLLSTEPDNSDDVVPYKFGEKSLQTLSSTGYQNMAFKAYKGLGHPGSVILDFIINEECAYKHYTAKASRGAFSTMEKLLLIHDAEYN
ncbi:hypothetical protein Pyn_02931 [Prunus yedoensis var. nudiflora]|uniref:Uncharacterized protein n=1 Tax=Prunus yedoensis var. nudiflora TaxID=2094558 RepID=A0A314UQQ9_PRUYE|nr:hypothetical protein Pyn_02931 [Prunus yedoensis var. nudiflora]